MSIVTSFDEGVKVVDKVLDVVDDNVYSRAEHEADVTSRHLADVSSDSWLSKAIRPVITGWAMAVNTFIWVMMFISDKPVDSTVVITAGGVLTSAIGFYFYSKKVERVVAKKAAATIQIEKMKAKFAIREDKQELKLAKKDARIERRKARKEEKEGGI